MQVYNGSMIYVYSTLSTHVAMCTYGVDGKLSIEYYFINISVIEPLYVPYACRSGQKLTD